MKKKIIITTLVTGAIHFVVALIALCISFGAGMELFDNPEYKYSLIEIVANGLTHVLVQPVKSLWTPWMSKNLPNFVEWIFWGCNSLLWGFVFAILINIKHIINKKDISDNKSVHPELSTAAPRKVR